MLGKTANIFSKGKKKNIRILNMTHVWREQEFNEKKNESW